MLDAVKQKRMMRQNKIRPAPHCLVDNLARAVERYKDFLYFLVRTACLQADIIPVLRARCRAELLQLLHNFR